MVNMNKFQLISIAIVVLGFVTAFAIYPMLPEKVPIHWNVYGEVDNWGDPLFGAFIFPVVGILVVIGFWGIPKIMVFKENLMQFEREYYMLELLLILFFMAMYVITMLPNFGVEMNMGVMISPLIAILFVGLGLMMPRFKRNFFVGIKTPWTLANDIVWDKTHKLGGKVFIAMGLIPLVAFLFPDMFLLVFMVPLFAGIGGIVIYSYLEFRKVNGSNVRL